MWSPISRSSFIRYTAVSGVCWTPTQSPIKGIKYVPLQRRPEHSFLQNLWSQSLHETKYSPENDAKSPFAVPHTLSGRAVLRLWQCSSLCYSTAQASVQEPRLCWCVMGCQSLQSGWHHLFVRSSSQHLFDLFNTKVGISNLIWVSVS